MIGKRILYVLWTCLVFSPLVAIILGGLWALLSAPRDVFWPALLIMGWLVATIVWIAND